MTTYVVHRSDQVGSVAHAARPFLESRPVEHNLILTLLRQRIESPAPGRYWWITENGVVRGVAMQSPLSSRAAVTPVPLDAIGALAEAVVAEVPELPGIGGEAATVAAFAGAWTELGGTAARPVEGGRLYRTGEVVAPVGVPGSVRRAVADDTDVVTAWFLEFNELLDNVPEGVDLAAVAAARVEAGEVWVWERDGEVVSSAMITAPIAAASRVGYVYTPPHERGHGYAAANVAGLCAEVMSDRAPIGRVDTCLLYTQLHNAVSNRVYRRIGFRPVGEELVYSFAAT
jgi:uncharacterized protein